VAQAIANRGYGFGKFKDELSLTNSYICPYLFYYIGKRIDIKQMHPVLFFNLIEN